VIVSIHALQAIIQLGGGASSAPRRQWGYGPGLTGSVGSRWHGSRPSAPETVLAWLAPARPHPTGEPASAQRASDARGPRRYAMTAERAADASSTPCGLAVRTEGEYAVIQNESDALVRSRPATRGGDAR
jgi:hypothetical protein